MKVIIELEKEDFDTMHDVILDVWDIKPNKELIQKIWNELPEDIQGTAIQWGTNDTVFRDNLHEWLEKTKDEKK